MVEGEPHMAEGRVAVKEESIGLSNVKMPFPCSRAWAIKLGSPKGTAKETHA